MFADALIISLNCRHAAGMNGWRWPGLSAVSEGWRSSLMGFLHAHLFKRPTVKRSPSRRVNNSRPKNNWHFFVWGTAQNKAATTTIIGLFSGWVGWNIDSLAVQGNRDSIVTSWKAAHKSRTNATLQRNESADKECQIPRMPHPTQPPCPTHQSTAPQSFTQTKTWPNSIFGIRDEKFR